MSSEIILIAHNLRSCQNVGSLLRTCEGLGVNKVYLSGYTPYPIAINDDRLPYLREKINKRIVKASLGAENLIDWEHQIDIFKLIDEIKAQDYSVIALEQSNNSVNLDDYSPDKKIALIIGREVEGIENDILDKVDKIIEIPMLGKKESFNVVQAAAIALYKLKFN